MSVRIQPCLWFDGKVREAANFYASTFPDAAIAGRTPVLTTVSVGGMSVAILDGGPAFKVNPSLSFFYRCESELEIAGIWRTLSDRGRVRVELGPHPLAQKYGWLEDRYGVSWRLILGSSPRKAFPILAFAGSRRGRAEEALRFYASVFRDSKLGILSRYGAGQEPGKPGELSYGEVYAGGTLITAHDSAEGNDLDFSEAVSLAVPCETQGDINYYWKMLSKGGEEGRCGWLKDKFGFSWQVVPTILEALLADPDRGPRVTEAFMKMGKFDIGALLKA